MRQHRTIGALIEGVTVAASGALLGAAAGALLAPWLAVLLALVGALNGAISGWRGIYPWRHPTGVLCFVVDSSWAALPVALAAPTHLIAALRHGGYEPSLSVRQGRHVYRRGAQLKPGFALTMGNVISGAGDVDRERRRRLITDHEAVHVAQCRVFGPCYPLLYVVWAGVGAAAGVCLWLARGRRERLGAMVETCSYYLNPFEWWAYSRDALWPPPGKVDGVGWRRPAARPLAEVRRGHRH